jgi:hypothetical protein
MEAARSLSSDQLATDVECDVVRHEARLTDERGPVPCPKRLLDERGFGKRICRSIQVDVNSA